MDTNVPPRLLVTTYETPEDYNINLHHHENLKCYAVKYILRQSAMSYGVNVQYFQMSPSLGEMW
jgi:hypothetical protein